jgi:hypothetical protein
MIVFNECRIDSEGKYLIVEASVENLDYFKNVYIESMIIDTQDTFSANGPSENPIYSRDISSEGTDISEEGYDILGVYRDEENFVKYIRLRLPVSALKINNINDNIFFIYIGAGGTPSGYTPCGMDNQYTLGIAVNLRPIYNKAMSYLKEFNTNCETPKGFIDMILRLKAFELSLKTGNYLEAIEQWNTIKNNSVVYSTKSCGCHGSV